MKRGESSGTADTGYQIFESREAAMALVGEELEQIVIGGAEIHASFCCLRAASASRECTPRSKAARPYAGHIEHAVKVAGHEHVGLSTDNPPRGGSPWATKEEWYEPRLKWFKPRYYVCWPP